MSLRSALFIASYCIVAAECFADTVAPQVLFGNGATVTANYLNEKMDQINRFGFIFDNNPKTIWYFPAENKPAILTIRSKANLIGGVTLNFACSDHEKIQFETEKSKNIKTIRSDNYLDANFSPAHELKVTLSSATRLCINDLDIKFRGENKHRAFIEATGGGYPEVYLYAQGKWTEHFEAGNVVAFSMKKGKYAVFVLNVDIGPLGGIRIVNVETLKSIDYLSGKLLDFDSIRWKGDVVSGLVVKPEESWRKEKFEIRVSFP